MNFNRRGPFEALAGGRRREGKRKGRMAGEGVSAFLDFSHCWGARGESNARGCGVSGRIMPQLTQKWREEGGREGWREGGSGEREGGGVWNGGKMAAVILIRGRRGAVDAWTWDSRESSGGCKRDCRECQCKNAVRGL